MKRIRLGRHGRAFGGVAVAALAVAAGIAYATIPGPGNVYSACMLKGVGTIRLIDKSLPATNLMSHCTDKETEISWNQAGQPGPAGPQGLKGDPGAPGTNGTNGTNGTDGVGVTTASEPSGANCAGGGVQLTAVSGVSYVCNGKDGAAGKDGTDGTNGADGVSVTSAVEPAGTNCANGGSRFTAANGVTYACNGAPGSGGSSGWNLSGNAGTNPSTDFLGTSDDQPFNVAVNGARVLHLESGKNSFVPDAPNVIGGFAGNNVGGQVSGATIAGGGSGRFAGDENAITGTFGAIGGGHSNRSGAEAFVGGGFGNVASGSSAAVGGGELNVASGTAALIGGGSNNHATGLLATIPGGFLNTAGSSAFAAGTHASATHFGSFVWADNRLNSAGDGWIDFASTASNEFAARATGGFRFVSAIDASSGAPTAGVSLAPGSGSWSNLSDRTLKRNFAPVKGRSILERIAGLPISTWSYKAQKRSIRHLGPTAQDFSRAFGLGEDNRHIDTIDSEGVSLAGVQELYQLVQAQQREIRKQQRQIDVLERRVARLDHRAS